MADPERPSFLVTIDVEGDNAWSRPRTVTTANAAFMPRFQALCDRYGVRPTYLTNFEMARAPAFQAFGRAAIEAGTAEIGMHLHAWDSPPLMPLTDDDIAWQPFLIEYPDAVMQEKIHVMTATLEEVFGVKMVSHRAGRWALDERYARMLLAEGYGVDCSVTPLVSWRAKRGAPQGHGGPDYSRFPSGPYWMDPTDIGRPGQSPLLQVPVTILPSRHALVRAGAAFLRDLPGPLGATGARVLRRISPTQRWLRPTGRNRHDLRAVLLQALEDGRVHAELALHSSELMPGGSPTFPTASHIERLYDDLEALFVLVAERFAPRTLAAFRQHFLARYPSGGPGPA